VAVILMALAMPLLAQEPPPYEPPQEAPSWVSTVVSYVINFFAPKYVLPFSAAMGGVLIALVGLIRQGLTMFGGKLSAKAIYVLTAILSILTSVGGYASDGKLAGDELAVIAAAIFTLVAALFGYKLIFSAAARTRLGK
jgi:hypothetical protein